MHYCLQQIKILKNGVLLTLLKPGIFNNSSNGRFSIMAMICSTAISPNKARDLAGRIRNFHHTPEILHIYIVPVNDKIENCLKMAI